MNRGSLGVRELNLRLQSALNPPVDGEPVIEKFGWQFRMNDKVIQTENNYDKEVFNGDIGRIISVDQEQNEIAVLFDDRSIPYEAAELDELVPAYAISVHKSQGNEYPAVILPLLTQHYMLLQRNLLYTAITRGRKLVVLVGTRRAIAMAVKRAQARRRITTLAERLKEEQAGASRPA